MPKVPTTTRTQEGGMGPPLGAILMETQPVVPTHLWDHRIAAGLNRLPLRLYEPPNSDILQWGNIGGMLSTKRVARVSTETYIASVKAVDIDDSSLFPMTVDRGNSSGRQS